MDSTNIDTCIFSDKAYILGLGPTLEYFAPNGTPTIGVNDINSKLKKVKINHTCNHLVIQDKPTAFNFDRYTRIITNPPKEFVFSNQEYWKDSFGNFVKLRVIPYAMSLIDEKVDKFNKWELPSSRDSTFLACLVAFRLGAKEIITYGVDFTNHPRLSDEWPTIKNQYRILAKKLKEKGVTLYCSSKESRLSEILPIKLS